MTNSSESRAPETEPASRGRDDGRSERRDAFFDNAKYLAIVLVCVGHAWGQILDGNRAVETAYRVVYAFHMPAFIIISGYFSRSFDLSPKRVERLITGVVVPYVVFETAFALHQRYSGDAPDTPVSLLDPSYHLWFLCALFVWRLTTPLWRTVRHPLPLALVIAALASVSPEIGSDFDLQRVLQFLPCFVLGLLLKPEHFRWVRRRSVRILSVPVVVVAAVVAWWSVPRMELGWLHHNTAAQTMGAPWWSGPVMTLALFGCALILTACFLAWVPGRRLWFTVLGAGTIYGYLLHAFLLKEASYEGWFDLQPLRTPLGTIGLTVVAVAVVTALCTEPVRRVLRYVVEPRTAWAFRRDGDGGTRGREGRGALEAQKPHPKVPV
ncbi:acyltransferase family protein [Streptomyces sp. NPDC093586]|uniref:acyltransferase family protein n=1 Tax=Streptomyces sp. NPDC093586 TaxID=3366042 RepID=UPI0037FC4F6C